MILDMPHKPVVDDVNVEGPRVDDDITMTSRTKDESLRMTGSGEDENVTTRGVELLMGDVRRAILRISFPIMAGFMLQSLYNFTDSLWVSRIPGEGDYGLATVGYIFPLVFILIAISNGLGIGVNALISQRIGADDRAGAVKVANNGIALYAVVSVLLIIPPLLFTRQILGLIGAGEVAVYAEGYARIIMISMSVMFGGMLASTLMRAEGDSKRPLYAMALGTGLNIVLDPLFIFTFDMGIEGAAWASLLARTISIIPFIYWFGITRSTYVVPSFKGFHFERDRVMAILRIGLPASASSVVAAMTILLFNGIVTDIAGPQGVAITATGFRIGSLATLPTLGIAGGLVSVVGAALGSRDIGRIRSAFKNAVGLGIAIEAPLSILFFIFAPAIISPFTADPTMAVLADDLVLMLRIMTTEYVIISLVLACESSLQAVDRAGLAGWLIILRTAVVSLPVAYILSITLGWGLPGAWWGIIIGDTVEAIVGLIIIFMFILPGIERRIREGNDREDAGEGKDHSDDDRVEDGQNREDAGGGSNVHPLHQAATDPSATDNTDNMLSGDGSGTGDA